MRQDALKRLELGVDVVVVRDVKPLQERTHGKGLVPVLGAPVVEEAPFLTNEAVVPHLKVLHSCGFVHHFREPRAVQQAHAPPPHVCVLGLRHPNGGFAQVGVHEHGLSGRGVLQHGVAHHRGSLVPHAHVVWTVRHQPVPHAQVQERHSHDLLITQPHIVDREREEEFGVSVHECRQSQRCPRPPLGHNHLPALVRVLHSC
mmetsp:Transcript_3627/g.8630  ORF Transcript_3627/g.8630 Transcript_3627/m.8630 type:complete len:202 (+) Transcript_3627:204-809(+)